MGIRGFDLNLLPALDALLDERNVTRAAQRCCLSQSAMSATLARLRRHFDDPLLIREGREYHLSTRAEALVQPVRDAMHALEVAAETQKPFDPSADARTFTISLSDYAGLVYLRPLLAALATDAPQVRLTMRPIRAGMADGLRRGSLDLVLLPMELAEDLADFHHKALFADRFVLAADRDNPAFAGLCDIDEEQVASLRSQWGPPDLDLVRQQPFVATTGEMPSLIEVRLREKGESLRVDVTTESFLVAPFLVAGTSLVSFVQERLGRLAASNAPLRLFTSPIEVGGLTEAMFWNPRRSADPGHRWLRSRMIAQAQRLTTTADRAL